jgi:DNA-binding response OmpR family regulator
MYRRRARVTQSTSFYEPKTFEMPEDLLPAKTCRVLLLEDDDELAATVKELLSTRHYLVDRVRNGAEGLKLILERDYHAIVCDMVMPSFPGDMFYVAVERSKPHLCQRFVFTTAHRAEERIHNFLKEVRALVVWKPFQAHELFDAIDLVARKATKEE